MAPLDPAAPPAPLVRPAPRRSAAPDPRQAVARTAPVPSIRTPVPQPKDEVAWERFLAEARALPKTAVLPPASAAPGPESLAPERAAPLRRAVIWVPPTLEPGLAKAVDDLQAYLERMTGRPVARQVVRTGTEPTVPAGTTAIAVGAAAPPGHGAAAPAAPGGYAVRATTLGQGAAIAVDGADLGGRQRAVYRLMELTGARFFSYTDRFEPARGEAKVPVAGFEEAYAPPKDMAVRGFAPHLYHPIPLSVAFHEPSPANLAKMKAYVDWLAATGQTYLKVQLLEQDATNKYLPFVGTRTKYEHWLPHGRAVLDYAHARGIKVSVNVAFANYTSKNAFAINPLKAAWQSWRLDRLIKAVEGETDPRKKAAAEAKYVKYLDQVTRSSEKDIGAAVDRLMRAPWDEVSWNMGTSEFTPTSDDLTIRWMDAAVRHLRAKHPGVATTAVSHVPNSPFSAKYGESYFNLVRFADPGMGAMVHTTHAYGLLDPAPVYGNQDFAHKLRMLFRATPERSDVYYPESSYWVTHDADVPLFLPVYALNRRHDLELVRRIPDVDGHVTFTSAWEWGYWLTDYAAARMQARPELDLTAILDGAMAPLGPVRQPMVGLMREVMLGQQQHLIDGGLIRHLQGHDFLSDLGANAGHLPIVGKLVHGANNIPRRVSPGEVKRWSLREVTAFERGELARIAAMARDFEAWAVRGEALAAQAPADARKYADEVADGLRINALRARQAQVALAAVVLARKADITRDPAFRAAARGFAGEAERLVEDALVVIRRREAGYREGDENWAGSGPTMWGGRVHTRTHEAAFWRRTAEEARKAAG